MATIRHWRATLAIATIHCCAMGIALGAGTEENFDTIPTVREVILKTVQSNFERLRDCFKESVERKDSSIPTKLTTLFRIGKFGSVQSVTFEETAEMSAELNRCIVGQISHIQFPSRGEGNEIQAQSVRLILNFALPQGSTPASAQPASEAVE